MATITHRAKAGATLTGAEYEAADAHLVPEGSVAGVVPVGGIVMWSGTIAAIPTPAWQLCDGTANAPGPDLRDKFVVGARQDSGGVAKTNIEGTLKQSATQTGASVADHSNLSHAGGAVADHTGLTHDGSVGSHPDLTHAALSHPAITVVHADHSVASGSHTHASGADVSVPSLAVASGLASRPAVGHTHASIANASAPSAAIASQAIASGADVSVASGAIASQAIASGADVSVASQAIASGADVSVAGQSFTTLAVAGSVTRSVITTGGLQLTLLSTGQAVASHSHASALASRPTLAVAAATASRPSLAVASASVASSLGSRPSLAVASGSVASNAAVSVPALAATEASGVDVSTPSQAIASLANASRPSLTGSGPAATLTHADHSLASLSHQDIGTHLGSVYGTHAFTPPAGHGTAGTLTHAFTQPSAHAISAHSTVAIVPAYFALAFIQRMS